MNNKSIRRQKIRYGIRKKIAGTSQKPRLSVFRSNTDIYAQIIDDVTGHTLAAASSKEKEITAQKGTKSDKSKLVGQSLARKAGHWASPLWCLTVAVISIMAGLRTWRMEPVKAD
jgi:large subunit ribosomal protein L18